MLAFFLALIGIGAALGLAVAFIVIGASLAMLLFGGILGFIIRFLPYVLGLSLFIIAVFLFIDHPRVLIFCVIVLAAMIYFAPSAKVEANKNENELNATKRLGKKQSS